MHPVERHDLRLVREQDVHVAADEIQELRAVPLHAERIRECQCNLALGSLGDLGRLAEGRLGLRAVEQIALQVDDLRRRDELRVDLALVELRADTEERVHRPLAVRRDEDQRAGCGLAAGGGLRLEGHACRSDVVREDAAELVVRDLADERRLAAERGDACHRIGGGPARDLDRRPHRFVERRDGIAVDEPHVPLGGAMLGQKGVVAAPDDIDDRIPDPDDVVGGVGHDP